MNHVFKGAGVALVTPFTEENKIDFKGLEKIVRNQVNGGTDYLVVLGTTAETPTLSTEEQHEVVNFIKDNASGLPVVVGMGGNDTKKILKHIDTFNLEGVSGLLIVTPYYNKPSQEGMYNHYSEIASVSPVPVILYNVPSRTGVNIEADTVIKLAELSEKIVAVKEASGDLNQISRIIKYAPDNFSVISGDDAYTLPMIALGAKGVISVIANALPKELSNLAHSALNENFESARKQHHYLSELFKLLFKEGNPAGVKALLNIMGLIENNLRSPLFPVSGQTYNDISWAYQQFIR
ncbi:MAG: 4-hydroxy-tetrahydrodipicolinate synthase [Prolixibacteraceae bacterium]|nr:4-hydroxy-tetrahydrodipicolinate synthase [Prolixibacteraceae bacterium]